LCCKAKISGYGKCKILNYEVYEVHEENKPCLERAKVR